MEVILWFSHHPQEGSNEAGVQVPVGAESAGCPVGAQGCGRCGCLLGTGTADPSCPKQNTVFTFRVESFMPDSLNT